MFDPSFARNCDRFLQTKETLGEINESPKEPVVEIKPTGNLEHITEKPALFTGGDLRDYQMRGLQWMNVRASLAYF